MVAGDPKKTDYKPLTSEDTITKANHDAATEASIAAATTAHVGGPLAAAIATAAALRTFRSTESATRASTPGSSFTEGKFVKQAILDSMSAPDRRKSLDREKGQLVKHKQYLPPFLGSQ